MTGKEAHIKTQSSIQSLFFPFSATKIAAAGRFSTVSDGRVNFR
jgi:hypothetical protein